MSKFNNSKKEEIGQAWQYKIRKEAAEKETDKYWLGLDLNLKNAVVKPVTLKLAKSLIEKYEWLGTMAAINKYAFGIFFEGVCGGVVVFGLEYSDNLGVWDKYGFTGKIILLNRGVCLHWTPINTASKLISGAMNLLPKQYEVVTCTTDHLAGEVGTIYQACNFYYVGSMRDHNPKLKNKNRFGVVIENRLYGSRAIRTMVGSQKKDEILKKYPEAQFVKQKPKHRYFYFRNNKKLHYKAIEKIVLPYIKRKGAEAPF